MPDDPRNWRLSKCGSIAVDVNSPDDRAGRDQIRAHLKEIAAAFRQGDFAKPFMTHSEQPPGVPELQRLKSEITYIYTETPRGGIVRIIARDFLDAGAAAVAVHGRTAAQSYSGESDWGLIGRVMPAA